MGVRRGEAKEYTQPAAESDIKGKQTNKRRDAGEVPVSAAPGWLGRGTSPEAALVAGCGSATWQSMVASLRATCTEP